jgi:Leucine-rich repeat (LRR) protein
MQAILKKKDIKESEVQDLILADNDLSSLCGLEKLKKLQSLDISYNRLGKITSYLHYFQLDVRRGGKISSRGHN